MNAEHLEKCDSQLVNKESVASFKIYQKMHSSDVFDVTFCWPFCSAHVFMYRRGRMSVFVYVSMRVLGGQRSALGVFTQKALHHACEVSSSQDWSSPSGPGLMASQTQTASCLCFSSGFARTHDKFYFMWVLEIQLGLSYLHGKPFTRWAIVPPPLYDSFLWRA